jgi:Prp19/Pso4-like
LNLDPLAIFIPLTELKSYSVSLDPLALSKYLLYRPLGGLIFFGFFIYCLTLIHFTYKYSSHAFCLFSHQELSYALYAQDAASRVIARLLRERDAARECVNFWNFFFVKQRLTFHENRALANVQASMGITPSTSDDVEMSESGATDTGLPSNITAQIDETHQALSAACKRKPPQGYSNVADVKIFVATHTNPSLHSASPAGITSLAVHPTNSIFALSSADKTYSYMTLQPLTKYSGWHPPMQLTHY